MKTTFYYLFQRLLPARPQTKRGFSLTEALLAAVLVGVVGALAVGTMNVVGQLQAIQANKVVQAAMMEIQAGFTKYKRLNGLVNDSSPYRLPFEQMDGTVVTGVTIDGFLPNTTITCNALNNLCRRLKSGAIVLFDDRGTTLTWGTRDLDSSRNVRIGRLLIDPDGVDSDASNDAGQSVKLIITMQGHFMQSHAEQWDAILEQPSGTATWATVTQPNYFRFDK